MEDMAHRGLMNRMGNPHVDVRGREHRRPQGRRGENNNVFFPKIQTLTAPTWNWVGVETVNVQNL